MLNSDSVVCNLCYLNPSLCKAYAVSFMTLRRPKTDTCQDWMVTNPHTVENGTVSIELHRKLVTGDHLDLPIVDDREDPYVLLLLDDECVMFDVGVVL